MEMLPPEIWTNLDFNGLMGLEALSCYDIEREDLCAALGALQVIRPGLHHFRSLR